MKQAGVGIPVNAGQAVPVLNGIPQNPGIPDGVRVKDKNGNVLYLSMRCKFNTYNCGVRMCGRLAPSVKNPQGETLAYYEYESLLRDHKNEIIKEFSTWANACGGVLNQGNNIFPNDTGTYKSGIWLFADRLDYTSDKYPYYSNFRGLIRELQDHPEHGWMIIDSFPLFGNQLYATSDHSLHLSRIWGLVPPDFKRLVFTKDNWSNISGSHKSFLKKSNETENYYFPKDIQEINKIIS